MAFTNEYVPKIENEESEFFRKARTMLRLGFSSYDMWTVDRENESVLVQTGSGHQVESANQEYWQFIDLHGIYGFTTRTLERRVFGSTIFLKRDISFREAGPSQTMPSESTIASIKAALQTYKDYGVISKFSNCELELVSVDGRAI